MKTLQNNFTTPKQSKRLLELGVHANSADCYYSDEYDEQVHSRIGSSLQSDFFERYDEVTPCWSVGRLIEIISECYMIDMRFRYFRFDHLKGGMVESLIATFEELAGEIDFSKLEE